MADVLQLKERVRNAILVGESDFREFKSALEGRPDNKKPRLVKKICEDIAEGLVAFANTDGGEIIIGVEDDATITGIPHSEEDIETMLNSVRTHIMEGHNLPLVHNVKINIDDKIILFFQVEKGTTEIYQLPDGRIVIRKDKRTVPAHVKRLQFDRQESKSREFDRQFVDGANVNDLDIPLIQSYADKFLKGLTVEKYLQQIGLAEYSVSGLKLRQAALLLFAKDIQKWYPRSQVRILKVAGTSLGSGDKYNVISDEFVQGNIFELIIKSWEALRPFLAFKTIFSSESKFEQQFTYPEEACREALLNAIAHRDYANYNGIEVYIYDDRMEIKSPGALLSTLTIHDLLTLDNRHESRNSKITYVLKINEFMREIGEGMKRIFTVMSERELDKPKLYSNTSWFTVTLFNKSVYSEKQLEFLKMFEEYKLTNNQKKILILGMNGNELSPNEILKAMNTQDVEILTREMLKLRQSNLVIETKTAAQARNIVSNSHGKKQKKDIPRYKVLIPKK